MPTLACRASDCHLADSLEATDRRTSQTEWETQGVLNQRMLPAKEKESCDPVWQGIHRKKHAPHGCLWAGGCLTGKGGPIISTSFKSFTRGWLNPSMLPRVFGRFSKRYGCDTSFEPCSWNPCKLMSRWMDALTMMFENPFKTDKPVPMDWTQHAHMNREGNIWFSWENIHTPRRMVYTTLQKKEPR